MNNIIFLGDVHGNLNLLKFYISSMKLTNTIFIQLGDLGAGIIHQSAYTFLNTTLVETNNILYAIRGNHDDPECFETTHNVESNIIFVKDYDIIRLLDKDILFIGGAISIDRRVRVQEGYPYWLDEPVKTDPYYLQELIKVKNIDICVTHTAPLFVFPYTFVTTDKVLEYELRNERIYLEKVYELIKNKGLRKWYYGHFHNSGTELYDKVEFNLIDQNTIKNI